MLPFSSTTTAAIDGGENNSFSNIQQTFVEFRGEVGLEQNQGMFPDSMSGQHYNRNNDQRGSNSCDNIDKFIINSGDNSNRSNMNEVFSLQQNKSASLPNMLLGQSTDSSSIASLFSKKSSPACKFSTFYGESVNYSPTQQRQSLFSASSLNKQLPDTSSKMLTLSTEISSSSAAPPPITFSQRIPCKARGIKGKHDASNAYIEIPPNVQHGTVLTCSNTQCILTGRLFQFCIVCQLPVSKANFLKRHTHEGSPYLNGPTVSVKKSLHHLVKKSSSTKLQPEPHKISSSSIMSALLPFETEKHRQFNMTNNYRRDNGGQYNDMRPPKRRRCTSAPGGIENNKSNNSSSSNNNININIGALNNNLSFSSSLTEDFLKEKDQQRSLKKDRFMNRPVMTSIFQPNNGNDATISVKPLELPIKVSLMSSFPLKQELRNNIIDSQEGHTKLSGSSRKKEKEKTLVTVTAEEMGWISLFKGRPKNADNDISTQDIVARERWLKEMEHCSGISIIEIDSDKVDSDKKENNLLKKNASVQSISSASLLPSSTSLSSRSLYGHDIFVPKPARAIIEQIQQQKPQKTLVDLKKNYYMPISKHNNYNFNTKSLTTTVVSENKSYRYQNQNHRSVDNSIENNHHLPSMASATLMRNVDDTRSNASSYLLRLSDYIDNSRSGNGEPSSNSNIIETNNVQDQSLFGTDFPNDIFQGNTANSSNEKDCESVGAITADIFD